MRTLFRALWIVVAAAAFLAPPHRADAAAVCIVMSAESPQFNETVEGFKKHLTQQAVSVEITMHSLSRDGSQPQDIARSLSQAKATHLLVLGSQASQLAAQGNFGQPAIAGLVFSMADLAGTPDVTGVYLDIGVDAQLALIKRLFPQAARVGVLYSVENEKKIAEAAKIAQKHGLKLEAQEAFAPKDIPPALESVGKRADLLWGLMDKVVLTPETTKRLAVCRPFGELGQSRRRGRVQLEFRGSGRAVRGNPVETAQRRQSRRSRGRGP
jgi:ABC-type uncharacterized transport system substrate-binding protein